MPVRDDRLTREGGNTCQLPIVGTMPHTEQVRVLHWNVHSWRDAEGKDNLRAVAEVIRETMPHAVCFVEVNEPWGEPSALAEVAAEGGYSWIFGPCLEFQPADPRGFGNAVLARVPVTGVQQWRVFTPGSPYDGTEPTEPRTVLLARLALPGAPLWLGSTHFPASDQASRCIAADRLKSLLPRLPAPWIVCGDYNATRHELFGGELNTPAEATYPAHAPMRPIDYVLASDGLSVRTTVLRVEGSDHLPVLAEVGFS